MTMYALPDLPALLAFSSLAPRRAVSSHRKASARLEPVGYLQLSMCSQHCLPHNSIQRATAAGGNFIYWSVAKKKIIHNPLFTPLSHLRTKA